MPRAKLTPEQIASIPKLLAGGKHPADLARDWGVHRTAILYHSTGGKANRAMRQLVKLPWDSHLRAGHAALRVNKRAEAAAHFWKTAELLATHT